MQIGVIGEFYGHFQEFGTSRQPARPFVRPAWDRGAKALINKFREELARSLTKVSNDDRYMRADLGVFSMGGGFVQAGISGNDASVILSNLDPSMRGTGVGVGMYRAIIDEALSRGMVFHSDKEVSDEARRVYSALSRRGYRVEPGTEGRAFMITGRRRRR